MVKQNFLTKMLLLCALIVGSVSSACGQESWTWTASATEELGSTSTTAGSSATVTLNGKSWTVVRTLISGVTYTGTALQSGCIQLGKNGGVDNVSMKTSAFDGYIIKKVSVECSSYNNAHKCSIKVGDNVYKTPTATAKWTAIGTIEGSGNAQGEIDIEFTEGARALYIKSVTIEYEEASSVERPTFSPDGGTITEATTVTMSAAEGCTIYYTTDGTKPTTNSASGTTVVIPASGTTTLKAIAVDGDNNESAVTTAVYTYKDPNNLSETKEGFTSTSGVLEDIVSFTSYQGGAGTAPGNYNDGIRLYQKSGTNAYGGYITLSVPVGYLITGFTITSTGTYATTVDYTVGESHDVGEGESLAKSSDYSKSDLFNSSVNIFNLGSGSSGRLEIAAITVNFVRVATVNIPESHYGTYCSEYALDFSGSGVDAYTAAYDEAKGKVVLTKIADGIVPANTGVVLYSETKGEQDIPTTTTTNTIDVDNEMVGVTVQTPVAYHPDSKYNYILQEGKFKKATGASLRANRAYLSTTYNVPSTSGAPELDLVFGDETTGIQNIERTINDNQYYTLDGRRVAEPTKGLYIVNGKKVVIK